MITTNKIPFYWWVEDEISEAPNKTKTICIDTTSGKWENMLFVVFGWTNPLMLFYVRECPASAEDRHQDTGYRSVQ